MTGIIIKGIGGFYYVKSEGKVHECKARGVLRKEKITPMIGDRVELNEDGSIEKIHPRTTALIRPPVANIDTLILVTAAAAPEPNLFLLDKMLVNAEINHIRPIICINKIDLKQREDIEMIYRHAGYDVVKTMAQEDGEAFSPESIEALMPYLKDHITAFAGLSGVGKSSILRLVTGTELETGCVSGKIHRGKHTTRHVELLELPEGGFVLDTPGFSSFTVEGIQAAELEDYFPEFAKRKNECRFRGCSHLHEPECVIQQAVADGEIAASRYESYRQIYEQLKTIKEWER